MRKQLFTLAGLAAAATVTASAPAAIITQTNILDGTVDGTYQTATITVSGLTGNLIALSGLAGQAISFSTGDGSGLWNQDDVVVTVPFVFTVFFGSSNFAAADFGSAAPNSQFDSGILTWADVPGDPPILDTTASPTFSTEMNIFQFSSGGLPVSSEDASVFDFNQGDSPVPGTSVDVFRVTWKRDTTLDISFIVTQGDAPNEFLGAQFAAIPAPGALALLGLAGIAGRPRRRRA